MLLRSWRFLTLLLAALALTIRAGPTPGPPDLGLTFSSRLARPAATDALFQSRAIEALPVSVLGLHADVAQPFVERV